jgi:hypothetical protein
VLLTHQVDTFFNVISLEMYYNKVMPGDFCLVF